jgi:hypothetical protein
VLKTPALLVFWPFQQLLTLSGPASRVGDWIFGLLGYPVYGEPVLGTIVAYKTRQSVALACSMSLKKKVMLLNPKELTSVSLKVPSQPFGGRAN